MTTITCPKCDYRFETTATTNTRCRQCHHVCTVPRSTTTTRPATRRRASPRREVTERWAYGIDLLCGHVQVSCDDDTAPDHVEELLWRCPVCGTFEQVAAVIGCVPADEADPLCWDELLGNLFGEDEATYERAWDQLGDNDDDDEDDDDDDDQQAVTSP